MAGFKITHNSYSEKYRMPFGAVPEGEEIILRISVETDAKERLNDVKLLSWKDKELPGEQLMELVEENGEQLVFESKIVAPETPGLMWYCFRMNLDGNNCFYGNNEGTFGGIGHAYVFDPKPYQITVFKKEFKTPDWIKDGIMYQIFVDRFNVGKSGILDVKKNSFLYANWEDIPRYVKDEKGHVVRWDFFGGNLPGVIEKLNYLASIGVSVIYFNPLFEARSNHKYDTADFMKIDSMFGSKEIFIKLCQLAEKKGMKVILDGVFSHTGADSLYFNKFGSYDSVGAYQSQNSTYYPWYRFKGSRDDYESWWGVLDLPNVNEENPEYKEFIFGGDDCVINHWVNRGAAGWRLDVADEIPDSFIKGIRKTLKGNNADNLLIGEVWEDASNKISYDVRRTYLLGEGLDGVMNYPYRNNLISYLTGKLESSCFYRRVMNIMENYPKESFYTSMNMTSTHDSIRLLTTLGEAPDCEKMDSNEREVYKLTDKQRECAVLRLKQYFTFIATIPGFPSIYYGDEAGVEGFKDPLNRSTFPWGREDLEIQEWLKTIMKLRVKHQALRTGKFIPFYTENDIFGYIREITNGEDEFGRKAKDGRFVILFNKDMVNAKKFSFHAIPHRLDIKYDLGIYHDIQSGILVDFAAKGEILIPANGFIILQETSMKLLEKVMKSKGSKKASGKKIEIKAGMKKTEGTSAADAKKKSPKKQAVRTISSKRTRG